jgi:hypothetical protein
LANFKVGFFDLLKQDLRDQKFKMPSLDVKVKHVLACNISVLRHKNIHLAPIMEKNGGFNE